MKTIKLYGELAKRFGAEHKLAVRSPAEAIQAFCANFPGFREFMRDAHKYGIGFNIYVGTSSLKQEKDASMPSSDRDIIRMTPCIFGSGALAKTLIGAVLIVGGVLVTGLTFGAAAPIGQAMISVGVGLTLNGIYELLASPPNVGGGGGFGDQSQSFIFSGPENVTRQGGGVPVGYGRMMIGSTVISAGIEDADQ